jgi:hypothetical protein
MADASDARGRTDQRFADALSGPDGTGDPSVLMPVLQVYPDALSAPMPDAMVSLPPLDPAALARASLAARQAMPPPAQPAWPPRTGGPGVAQPGRYGRSPSSARPVERTPRPAPAARGSLEPRSAVAPRLPAPRQPGPPNAAAPAPAWTGRTMSPSELTGLLRNTFTGNTRAGSAPAAHQLQPTAHVPTPPLPRRLPRTTPRNKGSGVWAVLVFLVVIAFASGLGQRIVQAISELFNR